MPTVKTLLACHVAVNVRMLRYVVKAKIRVTTPDAISSFKHG